MSALLPRPTTTVVTAWSFRAAAWGAVGWFLGAPTMILLTAAAIVTHAMALVVHALRGRRSAADLAMRIAVGIELAWLVSAALPVPWHAFVPTGIGLFVCLAIAYLVDVRHGVADPRRHGSALLYLVQLPVFPAGPLSRFHEFSEQLSKSEISMGGFSYGVRRIVTGLLKVWAIAGPLGDVADRIFALRVTRLSTDMAWMGAVCAALEVYFLFSGFSDVGIGLGRILGFRYPENFRRPYTADSVREFWRRWNVTLIAWLRDYLSLPIAGHDVPTIGRYFLTVAGFVVVGLWYRTTLHVFAWAFYFGTWLAIEAVGLGRLIERFPRVVRHIYVLLVVLPGWILLRASGAGPLLGYIEAMLGFAVVRAPASFVYVDPPFVIALVSAVVFAGPLVSWISRWRVSVDAATASLLMMMAATGVFVWRASQPLVRAVWPAGAGRRP